MPEATAFADHALALESKIDLSKPGRTQFLRRLGKRTGRAIDRPTELGISETIKSTSYRCPVCGEMVDAGSAEQILLHHEHVTHPQRFLVGKAMVA